MELVVATGNRKKLKEIQAILSGKLVHLSCLADFPEIPEPPENGKTFAENAVSKAKYYAQELGRTVLAEDSGLEVKALDGKPGVYSARFAGPEKRDTDNIAAVLKLMKEVPLSKRQASFTSAACVATPEGKTFLFEGRKNGLIALKPAGKNGFGYDPIFFLPELKKTFAELSPRKKNALSHRRIALEKVRNFLNPL
ncbi:MAG: XTP/dITP diphosphatase [Candidatus Omnitrophica bacterium]|nr:XTP/dITP diphosphatase [Candidatus Omnitrophota bacterium]